MTMQSRAASRSALCRLTARMRCLARNARQLQQQVLQCACFTCTTYVFVHIYIYIYISIYTCSWAGAAGSAKSSKKRAFSLSKMPKLILPAKEDEIGRRIAAPWTGEHVHKTLDRYASVLRDRTTAHSIDIQLPKYCSDRVVSKQVAAPVCIKSSPAYRLGCFIHRQW